MESFGFAIVAVTILAFGLVSERIRRTPLTPPMVFVVVGFLVGPLALGLVTLSPASGVIRTLAELTLVVLLFTDASRIDLGLLRRQHNLPVRLLLVGLPLTVAAGAGLALLAFPGLELWEAAVLGAVLAPTDAALGQAVVGSLLVPVRIRQALNVESGLNDGLALPIVLLTLSLAGAAEHVGTAGTWVRFTALQLVFGPLVGLAVGFTGGRLVMRASRARWMNHVFQELAAVGLALLAYAVAELVGGNGFIAAFVGGLTLGNTSRAVCTCLYEFAEAEGQLLSLLIFLVFGAALVPVVVQHASWPIVAYALASLTLVRLVPVALSLLGTRLRWETTLFLGWFGPRGIATVLFALLLLERADVAGRETVLAVAMTTVLLSVFLHGFTAFPAARWYGARLGAVRATPDAPEHRPVPEMPLRIPVVG